MPTYRYRAVEPSTGRRRVGELVADSPYQVRVGLRRLGMLPEAVSVLREERRLRAGWIGAQAMAWARRRRAARLIEFYESLSALLSSGTPLAQALDLLASDRARAGAGAIAQLSRRLLDRVRAGGSLAEAMDEHPDWFAPVDVALVRSASRGGDAAEALTDLATHHARADEFGSRLAMALAYPAMLLVFGVGVVVFLTTTTIPQLAGVLIESGAELPSATRWLLVFGGLLTERWPAIVVLGVSLGAAMVWLCASDRTAGARLVIPVLGRAILRGQVAAASSLLARLLDGGLPLADALPLVAPTVRNARIREAFAAARGALTEGRSTADALADHAYLEPVYCRVIDVGEQSGSLPETLRRIAERYRRSAERLTSRVSALLEPASILLLALMIGFVAYASIAPMLRLTRSF